MAAMMEREEQDVESTELEPRQEEPRPQRPPPLQFRLRSMLLAMVALGVLFGALKSLGVPAHASVIVLAVLAVSVPAAVVLLVAISRHP